MPRRAAAATGPTPGASREDPWVLHENVEKKQNQQQQQQQQWQCRNKCSGL